MLIKISPKIHAHTHTERERERERERDLVPSALCKISMWILEIPERIEFDKESYFWILLSDMNITCNPEIKFDFFLMHNLSLIFSDADLGTSKRSGKSLREKIVKHFGA